LFFENGEAVSIHLLAGSREILTTIGEKKILYEEVSEHLAFLKHATRDHDAELTNTCFHFALEPRRLSLGP